MNRRCYGISFFLKVVSFISFALISISATADGRAEHGSQLEHFRDCDECSEMIVIPSSDYQMGATKDEFQGVAKKFQFMYDMETPRHVVQVKSFALARFDVTRKQFAVFAIETGFSGKGCRIFKHTNWQFDPDANWQNPGFAQVENDPVVCVSWNDAQQYISWLNSKFAGVHHYRLPTEEEWEYAARAGTTVPMYWGNNRQEQCKYENARDNSASVLDPDVPTASCDDKYIWTAPVGSFKPNPWGLYDMLGNTEQWVADCSASDYRAQSTQSANACRGHILRGASWASIPIAVRAAKRSGNPANSRNSTHGFRLAASL